MAYFLKGNQTQFIFDKLDNEKLLTFIFEEDLVLYKDCVDSVSEQIPTGNVNFIDDNHRHYMLVPKAEIPFVKWRTVKLAKGGEIFFLDNLYSRAIQLLLSEQSLNRIGTGRIAITTEWQDDEGNINQATYEKDVYKILHGLIHKLSEGKISGVFIGKNAYSLWEHRMVELCHDIKSNLCYRKDDFKFLQKQKG
jgi:hypothetical protein